MLKLYLATSLLPILATATAAGPQAPEQAAAPKADYSQEASVIEMYSHKARFENDGTSTQEASARVRLQSDAGVQRYGLLTFAYASGTGTFEIEYVRVRKRDGTTVETTADSIQDMPSEVTRQAPFYSDLREKHVAVKGLGIGDVLEYKTITRVTKPFAPGHFWLEYVFSRDIILLREQLEVSVPRERAIKWKSDDSKPSISEAGLYRVFTWSSANLERKDKNEK
jgi:hypothetical protein